MKVMILPLTLCVVLTGCNTPSPRLMGGTRQDVSVAGSRFVIWREGNEVEVIRTSFESLPRLSEVKAKAEIAVAQSTGCRIREGSLTGDHALLKATLNCG